MCWLLGCISDPPSVAAQSCLQCAACKAERADLNVSEVCVEPVKGMS